MKQIQRSFFKSALNRLRSGLTIGMSADIISYKLKQFIKIETNPSKKKNLESALTTINEHLLPIYNEKCERRRAEELLSKTLTGESWPILSSKLTKAAEQNTLPRINASELSESFNTLSLLANNISTYKEKISRLHPGFVCVVIESLSNPIRNLDQAQTELLKNLSDLLREKFSDANSFHVSMNGLESSIPLQGNSEQFFVNVTITSGEDILAIDYDYTNSEYESKDNHNRTIILNGVNLIDSVYESDVTEQDHIVLVIEEAFEEWLSMSFHEGDFDIENPFSDKNKDTFAKLTAINEILIN